jgi:putative tributyrin esterase
MRMIFRQGDMSYSCGPSDDNTAWVTRTSIGRYVEALPRAVVMPAVQRSFYTDIVHGGALHGRLWGVQDRIGESGSFRCGGQPLPGALDICRRSLEELATPESEKFKRELEGIFGPLEKLSGSRHDLFALARNVAKSTAPCPKVYQCCGTEDFLYRQWEAAAAIRRLHASCPREMNALSWREPLKPE